MSVRGKRTNKMTTFRPLELDEDQVAADSAQATNLCTCAIAARRPAHRENEMANPHIAPSDHLSRATGVSGSARYLSARIPARLSYPGLDASENPGNHRGHPGAPPARHEYMPVRVHCPLCRQAPEGDPTGYTYPIGLERHLEGFANTHQCYVMKVAVDIVQDNHYQKCPQAYPYGRD